MYGNDISVKSVTHHSVYILTKKPSGMRHTSPAKNLQSTKFRNLKIFSTVVIVNTMFINRNCLFVWICMNVMGCCSCLVGW